MKAPDWLNIERDPGNDTPGYVAFAVSLAVCERCSHPVRFHASGVCHYPVAGSDSAPCGPCNGEQP